MGGKPAPAPDDIPSEIFVILLWINTKATKLPKMVNLRMNRHPLKRVYNTPLHSSTDRSNQHRVMGLQSGI
jgi:hypothetical protein